MATYYCPTSSVTSNHAVNIVGWDDNFPASSFKNKPAGDGAINFVDVIKDDFSFKFGGMFVHALH